MKIAVFGLKKDHFEKLIKKEKSLELVDDDPEIVLAFGGDGTFLQSEMDFPGIPKVLVRHPDSCRKYSVRDYKKVIKALVNNKFKIAEFIKIQGSVDGKRLIGLNDINIHYKPPEALRFSVEVDGKILAREVIGDGVVISTPYGSSGYFKSITKKTFRKGLGIAFNNPTEHLKERIVPAESVIKVQILRGEGIMASDCNKEVIPLKMGDIITVHKHSQLARILKINGDIKVKL